LKVKYQTVDPDSMVITRYGNQDGAETGSNPGKKGAWLPPPLDCICIGDEVTVKMYASLTKQHLMPMGVFPIQTVSTFVPLITNFHNVTAHEDLQP